MNTPQDSLAPTQVGAGLRNVRKAQERSFEDVTIDLKDHGIADAAEDVKDAIQVTAESVGTIVGVHNPMAKPAGDGNEVWLLDNTAYLVDGKWNAEFVVAYFKKNGNGVGSLMASVANQLTGLGKGKLEVRPDRIALFTTPIAPARSINVSSPSVPELNLGPSGSNGISSETYVLEKGTTDVMQFAALDPNLTPYGSMNTDFADPRGWLVISGIPFDRVSFAYSN